MKKSTLHRESELKIARCDSGDTVREDQVTGEKKDTEPHSPPQSPPPPLPQRGRVRTMHIRVTPGPLTLFLPSNFCIIWSVSFPLANTPLSLKLFQPWMSVCFCLVDWLLYCKCVLVTALTLSWSGSSVITMLNWSWTCVTESIFFLLCWFCVISGSSLPYMQGSLSSVENLYMLWYSCNSYCV